MSSSRSNINSSQEFWEVVEILKETANKYLVRWAGFDPVTKKPWPNSWVAKGDCTRDLIQDWDAKKQPRRRSSLRNRGNKTTTKRLTRSVSFKNLKRDHATPENISTPESISVRASTSSPYVAVPLVPSKRKAKVADNLPSDTDSDASDIRPKKRRKSTEEEPEIRGPTTVKVGPPGRVKEIVIHPHELSRPNVSSKQRIKAEPARSRSTSHTSAAKKKTTDDGEEDMAQEPSNSRHSSTVSRSRSKSKGTSRSGSANGHNASSPEIPVILERLPSKSSRNEVSQEIIPETTQQQSSSSQSVGQISPKKPASNVSQRQQQQQQQQQTSPPRSSGRITRPSLPNSRLPVESPIQSFSPSQKRIRKHGPLTMDRASSSRLDADDPIQDDHHHHDVHFDDWLHERYEEEESQPRTQNVVPAQTTRSNTASDLPAPTAIAYKPRRPVSGGGADMLTAIFGRLGKVFKAIEPPNDTSDPIDHEKESALIPSQAKTSPPLSTKDDKDDDKDEPETGDDDDAPEADDDDNAPEADDDDNAPKMSIHGSEDEGDELGDASKSFETAADEPVLDDAAVRNTFDEEEIDQLGPDDAADADADAFGSSIVSSELHPGMNSSLMVQAAQTQQTLQPVIESPVRQLDSALGLLHRKSEEIQALRDEMLKVQEEMDKTRLEMAKMDQEFDRSEDVREAQCMQISQLQAELIAARSEAAVNVVQKALCPQRQLGPPPDFPPVSEPEPEPPSQSRATSRSESQHPHQPKSQASSAYSTRPQSRQPDPQPQPDHPDTPEQSGMATEMISTPTSEWLTQYQRKIEELEAKVVERDHEINIFRSLYAQSSNSHADNLVELRRVKRDNDSLRVQATTGVRQANVFWKTQLEVLSRKLKEEERKSKLMSEQLCATQKIRDNAVLLPLERKKVGSLLVELKELTERYRQMGTENTKYRIELKERDDAELSRRREERRAEKRAVEMEKDELLWICHWVDEVRKEKCGAILQSRDALREHLYQAGHVV